NIDNISNPFQHERYAGWFGKDRRHVDAPQSRRWGGWEAHPRRLRGGGAGAVRQFRGGRLSFLARSPSGAIRARGVQAGAGRAAPFAAIELLREAAAVAAAPIDALRMAASVLGLGRAENPREDALTAIAAFPTIVGAYWRIRRGEAPVPVRSDVGQAAHYLHQ